MPSLTFASSFDFGVLPGPWGAAGVHTSGIGGAIVTPGRQGAHALQIVCAATANRIATASAFPGSPTLAVASFYIMFPGSLPGADVPDLAALEHNGPSNTSLGFQFATSKLGIGPTGTFTQLSATTVTHDVWYLVDIRSNIAANPWVIDWQINQVAQTQALPANAADTFIFLGLGSFSSTTGTWQFDDPVTSLTSADYPIGPHFVTGYQVQDTSGTHVQTAGDLQSDGSVNITNGDNSGNRLNEATPDLTSYVKAVVAHAGTSGYDTTVVGDAPLGYWALEETSGTVAADTSGHSHNGTYNGTVSLNQTGPFSGAPGVALDGSSGYVKINGNTYALGDTFSIEFWLNPANTTGTQDLFQESGGGNPPAMSINAGGAGKVRASIGGLGAVADTTSALTVGTWYHVVWTKATSTSHLYVNAVDVTGAVTNHTAVNPGSGDSFWGVDPSGSGNNFAGSLAKLAVYNVALTSTQVSAHYAARLGSAPSAYAEYLYALTAPSSAPWAVQQSVAVSNVSGTTANNEKSQLSDGTGSADAYALTNVGATTLVWRTKCWTSAPSGSPWTTALASNLRLRWGFVSTLGASLPFVTYSLIEAVFPDTGVMVPTINVETKADGTGTIVPAENDVIGTPITVYAIQRDSTGAFVGNIAGNWSLINITGGVVQSDLVVSADKKSAVFTGHAVGSAVIDVVDPGIVFSSGNIQAAINAAAVGTTVTMTPGTYTGQNVNVNKNITLVLTGCTLDGGGTQTQGLWITAAGATVDGGGTGVVQNFNNPPQTGQISIRANNVTVKNISSNYSGGQPQVAGVTAGGCGIKAEGGSWTGWTFNNVTCDHNGQNGFGANCGPGSFVNCTFTYNNPLFTSASQSGLSQTHQPYDPGWEAGGGKVGLNVTGVTFSGCVSHHNGGPGIWVDTCHNAQTVIDSCTTHHNITGIMFEASDGGTITNNVVYENGWNGQQAWGWPAGILLSTSRHVQVSGNTLAWNEVGLSTISQNRGDTPGTMTGISFSNNWVAASTAHVSGTGLKMQCWLQDYTGGNATLYTDSTNRDSGNNQFYSTQAPGPGDRYEAVAQYSTVAAFAATQWGAGSTEVSSGTMNAQLTAVGIPTTPEHP